MDVIEITDSASEFRVIKKADTVVIEVESKKNYLASLELTPKQAVRMVILLLQAAWDIEDRGGISDGRV